MFVGMWVTKIFTYNVSEKPQNIIFVKFFVFKYVQQDLDETCLQIQPSLKVIASKRHTSLNLRIKYAYYTILILNYNPNNFFYLLTKFEDFLCGYEEKTICCPLTYILYKVSCTPTNQPK